jgi:preprotein translocase SecE subunit
MSKMGNAFSGIGRFCGEVSAELKKCAWPTWPELFDSTVMLIISVTLLAALVAVYDVVLRELVKLAV